MNETITHDVIQSALDCGVREFIICAGLRNCSFVDAFHLASKFNQEAAASMFKVHYWPEERSAAFFALGRSRLTKKPVAIIVTSGTACGELLPAAMNAHYLSTPLLLITADRPPSFRGSGAPQAAEQVDLFKNYVVFSQDITETTPCKLSQWNQQGAAHLNVCLGEPQKEPYLGKSPFIIKSEQPKHTQSNSQSNTDLDLFFKRVKHPLVVVSTLPDEAHSHIIPFLKSLGAPLFLEGISGLREEPSLQHLRIHRTDKVLESARKSGYQIDGVLRIGGVPTHRIWRDLEYLENEIAVCNITETPFSGLSWNRSIVCGPIDQTIGSYHLTKSFNSPETSQWLEQERSLKNQLLKLYKEEPLAETSLIHDLSTIIPPKTHIYLGNSSPIREWDIAATDSHKEFHITASRGLNGIDGQISTFLGLCQRGRNNWAIVGDLTAIYDLAGFWILPQLSEITTTTVIINNGGGKFFERFSPLKEMLNCHNLKFGPLAELWDLEFARWDKIPDDYQPKNPHSLVEIIPNDDASKRFNRRFNALIEM